MGHSGHYIRIIVLIIVFLHAGQICCSLPSGRVVGIFSRSAPDDYDWLTRALKSSNLVKESRSVFISNREEHHFRDAVQDCDFTILYHTKNRGRINITNVTDSLYDEQLQYMSTYKGRVPCDQRHCVISGVPRPDL